MQKNRRQLAHQLAAQPQPSVQSSPVQCMLAVVMPPQPIMLLIQRVLACRPRGAAAACWQIVAFGGSSHAWDSMLRRDHALGCRQYGTGIRKQRIVFLGTPSFAANVLKELMLAAKLPGAEHEVVAVVTTQGREGARFDMQPQAAPNRSSAVAIEALLQGMHPDSVLRPTSARDELFLQQMRDLKPDLCITAAYGLMLPQRFLDIPRLGTLNIHPSLLPKYRGAAPVQRCLLDGAEETGVSLAYTVLQCDAGPVLAQEKVQVHPQEQGPELTTRLFQLGSALLLKHLPSVLSGQGRVEAQAQDELQATRAAKVSREDSYLDPSQSAASLHNKVRALAGWPGTGISLLAQSTHPGRKDDVINLKVLSTQVIPPICDTYRQPEPLSGADSQAHYDSCKRGLLGSGSLSTGRLRFTGVGNPPKLSQNPNCSQAYAQAQSRPLDIVGWPVSLWDKQIIVVQCGGGGNLALLYVRRSAPVLSKLEAKSRKPGTGSEGSILTGREFMSGLGKRKVWALRQGAEEMPPVV